MPLRKGSNSEVIGENIAELVRAGHAPAQAAAIAYKVANGEDTAAGICYRSGDSVLLLLRCASADFPHTWCFPGGGIEPGETAEQAAIRESQEEVGHAPGDPLIALDYDGGFTTFGINAPAPFTPVLNEEHAGYVWAPLSALPAPLHPGVAATLARLPSCGFGMDARTVDGNGWFEVKNNPISKAGVFPYSGRQLGLTGADADRIFQVFRPPEELADPECIESFKLIPWIDNHTMLGPVAQEKIAGAMPAERKGIQGVIGEKVFFAETDEAPDGGLFANIKVFSSSMAAAIEWGKKELSAGYFCKYKKLAGVWKGLQYDFVQWFIRGNHLALVQEGRMGPDVAVMDSLTFSFDAKEIEMPEETKDQGGTGAGAMTLEQVISIVTELVPQIAKLTAAMAPIMAAAEKTEVAATGGEDPQPMAADKEVAPSAAVAAPEKKKDDGEGGEGTPAGSGMDEATFVKRIAQRDQLARKISAHVGTFDHAEMTLAGVVAYGCDKLGIKADKGHESAALSGYLQAKPAAVPSATVSGMDSMGLGGKEDWLTKQLDGAQS